MISALFTRWPNLVEIQGCYEDALAIWKSRLRTHFKNTRSRCSMNIPQILEKKGKFGKKRASEDADQTSIVKKVLGEF